MRKNFSIGPVNVDLNIAKGSAPGTLCVGYTISTVVGGHGLGEGQIVIDVAAIQSAVMAKIAADGAVGWSLKQMKRKARRVANRVSINKIARSVSEIATDPRFLKVAQQAAAFYPPLGMPIGVAVKAANMYKDAKNGSPQAKEAIKRIVADAQAGVPAAQNLTRALVVFDAAGKQGHDVGGWADNVKRGWLANIPYRGNVEAALTRSPGKVARGLMNMHLTAVAKGNV